MSSPWAGIILMLSLGTAQSPPADPAQQGNATFETKKNLRELELCLTKQLSKRGDVTTFNADGMVTVMLREGTDPPLLIDLAPPKVTVTTRILYGTGRLIKDCL